MTTNADKEHELLRNLPELLRKLGILPQGYQCEVHLHRGTRKKRTTAEFEANWDPETDAIRISFSPMEEEAESESGTVSIVTAAPTAAPEFTEGRYVDLLRALDRAEGRPGYDFVSLKWFRDTVLLHEGFSWASDISARDDALREAIDRRWVLTSKVANPRPPHFPVTAIRLNRQMPEVAAALGNRTGGLPAFRPVPIRGEALSATVLNERR